MDQQVGTADGPARGRVAVIGAGIAGLVTARVLRDDGFEVTVFDKETQFGGVWASTRTYPGLCTNSPRECYAFSDHPYPPDADEFPTAAQVRAYLASYVERFDLKPLMRLGTQVLHVAPTGTPEQPAQGFTVTTAPADDATAARDESFDFVVVCSGTFSEPQMPPLAGAHQFAGRIVHSSQATDPALFAGRRVVVVGAGKSALDCAGFAARHGRTATLVYRTPHWMMPRRFFGVRCDWAVITRFSEVMIPYHRLDRTEAFLHGPGAPLIRAWWAGLDWLIRRTLGVPAQLLPAQGLPAGFESAGVGQIFYDALDQGRVETRHASITAVAGADELLLDTGEVIAADLVVCATGWRRSLGFLAPELAAQVRDERGAFTLYRHILPPGQTRLAFNGFGSSISNQLTAEVSAHWIAQLFRGELTVPPVAEMHAEISRVHAWINRVMPARPEAYFIGGFAAHHAEDLLRDMDLPTVRTGNFLKEHFAPYWATRFADLPDQRRQRREQGRARRGFYFSAAHAGAVVLAVLGAAAWMLAG